MIDAMVNEIRLSKVSPFGGDLEGAETIYFGGGTPSLLTHDDLLKLLNAVYKNYNVSPNAEITLEANPDDINEIKLEQWKKTGINRLSVGVQSFQEDDLRWMNRAHNAAQALHCITQIKNAGFINFSVDLIYGTPNLNNENWEKNVKTVIDLGVPHLSCYALTVEAKTALHTMISLKNKEDVDPEKQAAQFILLMGWMNKAGYEHYEISNFAKPGFRSRHNSSYWQGKPYIGFGPSAHSFSGEMRKWNISNNALYIQSLKNNIVPFEEEKLSKTQQLNEYIMTAIRTIEGIDLSFVKENFGENISKQLQDAGNKYIQDHKLQTINYKLVLTGEGKLFADGIASDLFF